MLRKLGPLSKLKSPGRPYFVTAERMTSIRLMKESLKKTSAATMKRLASSISAMMYRRFFPSGVLR